MTAIYAWADAASQASGIAADDREFVGRELRPTCAKKIFVIGNRFAVAICGADTPSFA
jgi:hypothetical protein